MNTRNKKFAAVKKGAKYSSAAAGAAGSALECIGIFVVIPGFIKWAVIAVIGLIAGCLGCCTSSKDIEEEEKQTATLEIERQMLIDERLELAELREKMAGDMAEIKQDLEYHRRHPSHESKLTLVHSKVDKWIELAREAKKQKELKTSQSGFFAVNNPERKETPVFKEDEKRLAMGLR